MSKAFNVSVDEILDNDSKEFLMNKISNTERLAGIIIKILKVIGFVFIGYINIYDNCSDWTRNLYSC